MKKVILSMIAVAALAGCASYDYYEGGIRYTQDGADCIYYAGEYGTRFSNQIRDFDRNKRIVYRNTRCEDLYARDTAGMAVRNERHVLAPAAVQPVVATTCNACNAQVQKTSCGCNNAQPIVGRKYVFVPAM